MPPADPPAPQGPPCPSCKTRHAAGPYVPRPDLARGEHVPSLPADVLCPCGATLRKAVPLFRPNELGWVWQVVKAPTATEIFRASPQPPFESSAQGWKMLQRWRELALAARAEGCEI